LPTENIFRIATSDRGAEDKFTAFLHYLVESIPSIGQGMVDVICQGSELPSAIFEEAKDHPRGSAESKPDFMLSCKEFDLLCEHKLESDLEDRQLERYLELPKNRPTYLALITNRNHAISQDVLQSKNYLRPQNPPRPFYYWEDFYPTIASNSDRLAQDFVKYMRDLGMGPSPLREDWKQLFRNPESDEKFSKVAGQFFEATMDMRSYFSEQPGAYCQADPLRLGFQVKYPTNWIPLLYFHVSKAANPPVDTIEPPYLNAKIFVAGKDSGYIEHLRDTDIHTEDGLIVGRVHKIPRNSGENTVLRYEYLGSLKDRLTEKTMETRAKLLAFGKTVFAHVTSARH
jgi:hypothetical protein